MSPITILLLFLLGAMAISFLCSILESVLMSTPLSYITMREDEGFKPATRFMQYKEESARPLAAILALNTIANTVGAAGVGMQATKIGGDTLFGIMSAVTTILILVFSEIIPKTIGTSYYRNLMGFTTAVLRGLIVLMYPIVILIELVTRIVQKDDDEASVSREEVLAMANVGEEEGVIDEDENRIIQNVIKLDKIKAYDVMTPRVVAQTASENMTLKNFYKDKDYEHYSRIPVYSESPEFITGYILRSEALEYLAEDKFDMRLSEIKRDVTFFNDEVSVGKIWDALLAKKEQIALIIDEYGCFQGIITLEDIIETILGLEIIDENDEVSDMQQYARERWQRRAKRFKEIQLPDTDTESD
ncbi:MAG: CNNM domain-containing protein [Bacteroidales bacterium]|nr:CNNM domain-containing protein [Bacteroidales bacterium]